MTNVGLTPIDGTSEVGRLRLLVGDTESVPLDPDLAGHADYNTWSDAALGSALLTAGGNQMRAAGALYLQLAVESAMTGHSIKTDDLALDTRGRGATLHDVAQSFFDEATAADNAAASDFFQIVPFGGRVRRNQCVRPEGTPYPICR